MPVHRYHRVDVFTEQALLGNPLAVFPDADRIDDDLLQPLAREMNLSETVFVYPPRSAGPAVRLRIFTVDRELPLAGHPVVGSAMVLASTGRIRLGDGEHEVDFELDAGILPVQIRKNQGIVESVYMTQNNPEFKEPFADIGLLAGAFGVGIDDIQGAGLAPRVVDTGIPWLLVPLRDLRALRALKVDHARCAKVAALAGTELFHAFTQDTGDPGCAVRARHVWFGAATPGEDPVTGSAIGCIASYLVNEGVILAAPTAEFTIEQGHEVGRPGKVMARVTARGGSVTRVEIGGRAVHVGDGEIRL